MMTKKITHMIPRRERRDNLCAVVTYFVTMPAALKDLDSLLIFLPLFKELVTRWTRETDEGKACLEYASNDLNIGDLASASDMQWFRKELKAVGVLEFDIAIVSDFRHDWLYDTVLVNEDVEPACLEVVRK